MFFRSCTFAFVGMLFAAGAARADWITPAASQGSHTLPLDFATAQADQEQPAGGSYVSDVDWTDGASASARQLVADLLLDPASASTGTTRNAGVADAPSRNRPGSGGGDVWRGRPFPRVLPKYDAVAPGGHIYGGPPPPIPEPTTVLLGVIGLITVASLNSRTRTSKPE